VVTAAGRGAAAPGGDPLCLVCEVGDLSYALPTSVVLELETYGGATRVPGTPPWVAGLAQVRTRVVPAIDLRVRFGLPAAPRTLDTRIVLVTHGPRTIGLIVDRARAMARLSADSRVVPLDLDTLLGKE
jgi:purine-binding chemotaxis protein CheW